MMTKEYIKEKIKTDVKWTERAILALYRLQTNREQQVDKSIVANGRGFNKPDSALMSYYARWLLQGKHLTFKFLNDAQRRVAKYAGQLYEIAKDK